MSERRSDHLSEELLAQFQDGHLPEREVNSHLKACSECSARLSDLEAAGSAYREYLASGSALPPPPQPWLSLDGLIAEYETKRSPHARRSWLVPAIWLAICFGIVIGRLAPNRAGAFDSGQRIARPLGNCGTTAQSDDFPASR